MITKTQLENNIEYCDDLECTHCGGDGYLVAIETNSFDILNDDPNEIVKCSSCMGSGLAKDQTWW